MRPDAVTLDLIGDYSHLEPLPSEDEVGKEVVLKELFRRVVLTSSWTDIAPRTLSAFNSDFSVLVVYKDSRITVEVTNKRKLLGSASFRIIRVGMGCATQPNDGTVVLEQPVQMDLIIRILKEILIFRLLEMRRYRKLNKKQCTEMESYRPTYPEPPAYIRRDNPKKGGYPIRMLTDERVKWLASNGFDPFDEGFQMAFTAALEEEFAEPDRASKELLANTCVHKDGYEFQIHHVERTRV